MDSGRRDQNQSWFKKMKAVAVKSGNKLMVSEFVFLI